MAKVGPGQRGGTPPDKELVCATCSEVFLGHPRSKNCPEHRHPARLAKQRADHASVDKVARYLIQRYGPGGGRFDHRLLKVTSNVAVRAFAAGQLLLTSAPDRAPIGPHRSLWHKSQHVFPEGAITYWLIEPE